MSILRGALPLLVASTVAVAPAAGQDLEVDHVFIMVQARSPAAGALAAAGFAIRPDSTVHEGIGTASSSARFSNAYLELVWVVDSADFAESPFGMSDRLAASPAGSPFGIGLRRASGRLEGELPFETSPYQAEWMLPDAPSEIAAWAGDVREPAVFVVAPPMTWRATVEAYPGVLQNLPHPNGIRQLTQVRILGPGPPVESVVSRVLAGSGLVEFVSGPDHVLELVFDGGGVGRRDFRPALPLVIRHR